MSPLWERNCKQQNKRKDNYAKLPSPKMSENSKSLAQDSYLTFFGIKTKRKKRAFSTIKGTFPFTLPTKSWQGSMTVEAALVLPLFLFFFLNLGSAMEMMRLHGKMETALWEVGREASVYGSFLELETALKEAEPEEKISGEGRTVLEELAELTLFSAYVKDGVEKYLGEDYLNDSPVKGGVKGFSFLGSDFAREKDCMEVSVTYQVAPFWEIAAFPSFWMENRYYKRLWTGYEVQNRSPAVYYLAENGEVYHTSPDCTHLRLRVQMISGEEAQLAVNEEGKHYRACTKCTQGQIAKQVWVAREGDCYHSVRECSGLKRTYRAVTWEEAKEYRMCVRCKDRGEL